MTDLLSRTALVTGASRGIGRATARALAAAGARVIVHYFQALQRVGHPEDVAEVASFLASDAARWVTGDTIQASGGSKI